MILHVCKIVQTITLKMKPVEDVTNVTQIVKNVLNKPRTVLNAIIIIGYKTIYVVRYALDLHIKTIILGHVPNVIQHAKLAVILQVLIV